MKDVDTRNRIMAGSYAHVAPSTAISAPGGTLPDRGVPPSDSRSDIAPLRLFFAVLFLAVASPPPDVLLAKLDGMISIHSASTRRKRPICIAAAVYFRESGHCGTDDCGLATLVLLYS
jgi:hypothetical protein